MAIQVKINSVDKTDFIERQSFKIQNILTSKVDECSLNIKNYGSHIFKPEVDDEIEILDGSDKIFAGTIVKVKEKLKSARILLYEVKCKDYQHLMDRKLVVKSYSSQTVAQIIEDIKDNYLPSGFTITNVKCAKTINYVAFNYEQPSKCLQRLAELVNYDWYVDYDKDIHFFNKEENISPFELTDINGKYLFKSLIFKRDNSQLKNVIFVRGGEYLGNSFTEEIVADGDQRTFQLSYKYASPQVWIGAVSKTLGIDYIDDENDYDCLFNFQEKLIRFRDNNKPTDGQIFKFTGDPYLPVIVKARDNISVEKKGEYEFKIIDKSIKTKESARERARAELEAYKETLSEGSFETYEKGLRSGQKISIQSDIRSMDEEFLINKVSMRMRTPDEMIYRVSLVTVKTFGVIEFLQKLLTDENKKITVNENEVLDKVETDYETVTVQELISAQQKKSVEEQVAIQEEITPTLTTPPFKWAPSATKKLRWNLGEWD